VRPVRAEDERVPAQRRGKANRVDGALKGERALAASPELPIIIGNKHMMPFHRVPYRLRRVDKDRALKCADAQCGQVVALAGGKRDREPRRQVVDFPGRHGQALFVDKVDVAERHGTSERGDLQKITNTMPPWRQTYGGVSDRPPAW
jgi:hypothetical protein